MEKSIERLLVEYEPDSPTAKALNHINDPFMYSPTTEDEANHLLGEIITDLMKKGHDVNSHPEIINIAGLTPTQGVGKEALDFYESIYIRLKAQGKEIPPIIILRYTDIDAVADGHHRCAALFYRMGEITIQAYVIEMPLDVQAEEYGEKTFGDLSEEELRYNADLNEEI